MNPCSCNTENGVENAHAAAFRRLSSFRASVHHQLCVSLKKNCKKIKKKRSKRECSRLWPYAYGIGLQATGHTAFTLLKATERLKF